MARVEPSAKAFERRMPVAVALIARVIGVASARAQDVDALPSFEVASIKA
jgi:hypothetical protein